MIEDENRDELIDNYLSGELDDKSMLEFRQQLAADLSLRQEVEKQRLLHRSIRVAGRADWKKRLKAIHNEMTVSQPIIENSKAEIEPPSGNFLLLHSRVWVAAASILIIIGSLFVFNWISHKNDRLFASNFTPYAVLDGSVRDSVKLNSTITDKAVSLYASGNFTQSIPLLKGIADTSKDEIIFLYLGNAYLANGQPELAENVFEKYLVEHRRFATESLWYLCLCWLKQGKKTKAIDGLKTLSQENNNYSIKASSILTQLR